MQYHRPSSLEELQSVLSGLTGQNVSLLAGGTDLMPRYEGGVALPDHLVDIKDLSALNQIRVTDEALHVGALTSVQNLHEHALVKDEFLALYQAAHEFAGTQIRQRATIGGNICNASPAGDLLGPLVAFGSRLILLGPDGERELPLKDFLIGPGRTALIQDEIVSEIIIPRQGLSSHFEKVGLRRSMAISVVNVTFTYISDASGFQALNIAAGAVAPRVVLLERFTEALLTDSKDKGLPLELIDADIAPIDDIRGTASYRRRVLKNLVKHHLKRLEFVHE